jgi:hypothetical protein
MTTRRDLRWKKEDSMARFRLSIASLMVVMIPLAIGLAAFQSATQLWVNLIFNLVVAVLLLALYKAKCSQGIDGAWWAGFASFDWCHLVVGLLGNSVAHYGVQPELLTAEITWRVLGLLEPDASATALQRVIARALVVHCVMSLLFAMLGATVFRYFAARRLASDHARRQLGENSPSARLIGWPAEFFSGIAGFDRFARQE